MTGRPNTAELRKLAHTLGVAPEKVSMVASLSSEDVRALRKQAAEALFQADRAAFVRVAALSKAVPLSLAAKVTEAVLPPLLAARTAELLEPSRAVELVTRISDGYLADVSAAMDPARSPEVVAAIPPDRIATVARELARREEWIVIAGFVDVVADDALAESIGVFDGGQLLRVGFVLDDLARLDTVGSLLTEQQLDELLAAAAADSLWAEFATLLENLAPPRRERLAERLAAAPDDVRAAIAEAVARGDVPDVLSAA